MSRRIVCAFSVGAWVAGVVTLGAVSGCTSSISTGAANTSGGGAGMGFIDGGDPDFAPRYGGLVAGSMIVTIDDADFPATALANGDTSGMRMQIADTLTTISLPLRETEHGAIVDFGQVGAPSSVLGGTGSLAVSPSGRLALVTEARASASSSDRVSDIPAGEMVTLIDISGATPTVVDSIAVGAGPVSASFGSESSAVVLCRESGELFVLDIFGGGVGGAEALPLKWMLPSRATAAGVHWRPGSDVIAVRLAGRAGVVFFELADAGGPTLRAWGKAVDVAQFPTAGAWSPDGRYFITAEQLWADLENAHVGASSGAISVIRVADGVDSSGRAMHEVVSSVVTPIAAHAMAVSPDGRRIAICAMRPGGLLDGEAGGGTVALYDFDPELGELRLLDTASESATPIALAFDATGEMLLVADFASDEVQFWNVAGGALEYTGINVGTGVGPHAVVVVP